MSKGDIMKTKERPVKQSPFIVIKLTKKQAQEKALILKQLKEKNIHLMKKKLQKINES
jgi:hypothetical protein